MRSQACGAVEANSTLEHERMLPTLLPLWLDFCTATRAFGRSARSASTRAVRVRRWDRRLALLDQGQRTWASAGASGAGIPHRIACAAAEPQYEQ